MLIYIIYSLYMQMINLLCYLIVSAIAMIMVPVDREEVEEELEIGEEEVEEGLEIEEEEVEEELEIGEDLDEGYDSASNHLDNNIVN